MPPTDAAVDPAALPTGGSGEQPLRRLPGRTSLSTRLFANYQLWLARDFLLHARQVAYSQEIQQFAYRDIQALEVCHSMRGLIYNVVLGVPLAIFVVLAAFGTIDARNAAALIFGGLLLGGLLLNLGRGPTCHCVLQTALGPHGLPSLGRRRVARRAVALIAERVEAAQARSA